MTSKSRRATTLDTRSGYFGIRAGCRIPAPARRRRPRELTQRV
ncbi:hypothetical protein [Lysobacter gummosus]